MTVSFASTGLLLVSCAGVALSAFAAAVLYRATKGRERRVRVGLAALRGLFVLLACLVISDPAVTYTATLKPVLRVVWQPAAALETPDGAGGLTRRAVLSNALDELRRLGLAERYDVSDDGGAAPAYASLVLTDGADAPDSLATVGGRTYALVPARNDAVPDLSVIGVRSPHRLIAGTPAELEVTTRARGAAGRSAVLTVSDSGRVLGNATRDVSAADELSTTAIVVTAQSVGWQRLVVDAAGLTGEVSLADNTYEIWVDVAQPDRHVLFVEGEPTWEGKFIRRALEADPGVTVDYVTRISKSAVIAQPEVDSSAPRSAPKPAGAAWPDLHAALSEERLFGYDAVVLGPLDASELNGGELDRIRAFVDVRGGALVILGENGYAGSVLSGGTVVAAMSPAVVPASSLGRRESPSSPTSSPGAGSVRFAPSAGLERHPVFAGCSGDPAAAFGKLQPLGDGYLRLGALRPGATTLAVDAASRGDSKAPLVVAEDYGLGRVVLVAAPDTWRLAIGAPDDVSDVSARLWSSLISWASAGARAPVSLDVAETAVRAGETVRLELQVRSSRFEPADRVTVAAHAELEAPADPADAGATERVDFEPDGATAGIYSGTARLDRPGTWRVVADTGTGDPVWTRVQVLPRAAPSGPRRPDPIQTEQFKQAVASRGGGVFSTADAPALFEALGAPQPSAMAVTSQPARSLWWALILPLLFSAEVFLRRWYAVE